MSQQPHDDVRGLGDAQLARTRNRLATALAITLVADTAVTLGGRSRPPTVRIFNPYRETVLEGTTVWVAVQVENANHVEIRVRGEDAPRRYVRDEPVVFTARSSGEAVSVTARNVLHPRATTRYSTLSVSPVPRVNPYTFQGARVTGLSGAQVRDLAHALTLARVQGLELDPWAAGGEVRRLSPEGRDAGRRDLESIDGLLAAVSAQVTAGLDFQHVYARTITEASGVRERSAPPSLWRLRWPRRRRGSRA